MAVLARRTWAQILTEVTLRLGNPATSGFDARLQYLIAGAYHDLCTTYHHTELDQLDTSKVCSTSVNWVALPADCFVLAQVRMLAVGSASILGMLTIEDFKYRSLFYDGSAGVPTKCSRFGNKLYFDKLPAAAYPLEIYYCRQGTMPDFATPTSPELALDVDEHIVESALRRCNPAVARPDLGDLHRQLLTEWLGTQVRTSLIDPTTALPEQELSGTTHTKGQG